MKTGIQMTEQVKKIGFFRKVVRGVSSITLLVFLLLFVLFLFPILTICILILLSGLFAWKFLPKTLRAAQNVNSYGNASN